VTSQGSQWWVKLLTPERPNKAWQANEYLYSTIARSALSDISLATYVTRVPKTQLLHTEAGFAVGIEYIRGLQSCRGYQDPADPFFTVMAVLDVCLLNSDRVCSNLVQHGADIMLLDHDHALLGSGTSDLIRFQRAPSSHPHGDYIRDRHFRPSRLHHDMAAKLVRQMSLAWRHNRDTWLRTLQDATLITADQAACLLRLPLWWREILGRIESGVFFSPDTWQNKCAWESLARPIAKEICNGTPRNLTQPDLHQ